MAATARRLLAVLLLTAAVSSAAAVAPAATAVTGNWHAYLDGSTHHSIDAADTAITAASTASLTLKWQYASDGFTASPTMADGAVFIGSNSGEFDKFDAATGKLLAQVFLGLISNTTCGSADGSRGFAATATVAYDSARHVDLVYVAAPDGYLYALRTTDLSVVWRSFIKKPSATVNDYYNWSSPTVANGRIYVGISSRCDNPLVRGGVAGYDQATGSRLAVFYTVPKGFVGGSVWSSVAVQPHGGVYVTTGNQPSGESPLDPEYKYTDSIIKLNPFTLKVDGAYQIPAADMKPDGDFGGSPTIFGANVGACNKNGIYYTLRRFAMTLEWKARIGAQSSGATPAQCSAAAAYDGSYLYIAGPATTIGTTSYLGSIRRVNPATGSFEWETGLPDGVIGSPAMNGGGVLSVGTYDTTDPGSNGVFLVHATTGRIVKKLLPGIFDFPQTVFANGMLYAANNTGLFAYGF
jgi:outer membrane protein assembly factor BamB